MPRRRPKSAAADAAPPLLDSGVLPVLLHHPCMQQINVVCRLLCTAKAFEQPISCYVRGQLQLDLSLQQPNMKVYQLRPDLLQWLGSHACLAKTLNLRQVYPAAAPTCRGMLTLTAALKRAAKAAAGTGGLALQAYSAGASSVGILQQLPAATLTSLHPGQLLYAELDDRIAAPRKALARLTNLRELSLERGDSNLLLPATAGLKQLTRLQLQQLSSGGVAAFRHLPQQLRILTFTADLDGPGEAFTAAAVALGHVTGMTELVCEQYTLQGTTFDLQKDDVLPPNLVHLVLSSVEVVQPVLDLLQLQRLDLWAVDATPAAMLQQLSGLQSLTHLRLGYFPKDPFQLEQHAAVWPQLQQLRALAMFWQFDWDAVPRAAVQQLSKCSGITQLEFQNDFGGIGVTVKQFAAALGQLVSLQDLQLDGCGVWFEDESNSEGEEDSDEEEPSNMQQLLQGLTGLQQLRSLRLGNLKSCCFDEPAGQQLLALTQLTYLALHAEDALQAAYFFDTRPALEYLHRMTGLRALRLFMPAVVTAPHVPSIARQLTRLAKIAYVAGDLAWARKLWGRRKGVLVQHIQPDGSTIPVFDELHTV